jgi:hypothetical protein
MFDRCKFPALAQPHLDIFARRAYHTEKDIASSGTGSKLFETEGLSVCKFKTEMGKGLVYQKFT